MPDAKGVEGSPLPRPSLRAAAAVAKRPFRKPDAPAPASAAPLPAAPVTPPPVAERAERREPERERPEAVVPPGGLRVNDLYHMPMAELFALAEREGIREHTGMSRAQLIVGIVRRQIERREIVRVCGTLEVLPDGYGFLRSQAHNYLASPEDIYVSPSQIRRMSLRTGLLVEGPIRLPIENQENFALMQIERVNGRMPD